MAKQFNPDKRIIELGLVLPPIPEDRVVFKPLNVDGKIIKVSGSGPLLPDGSWTQGRVGDGMSVEEGKAAARQTALYILATLKKEFGELNKIKRLVNTLGFVRAHPDFGEHTEVINGFSEVIRDVWGPDNGLSSRAAIGAGSLPMGIPVEIISDWELW